jgi:hypothetical protein
MTTIIHGHAVKADRVVFQQLALNKHWLPDDMINEIKDYLYISKEEALRKYYRNLLNRNLCSVSVLFVSENDGGGSNQTRL